MDFCFDFCTVLYIYVSFDLVYFYKQMKIQGRSSFVQLLFEVQVCVYKVFKGLRLHLINHSLPINGLGRVQPLPKSLVLNVNPPYESITDFRQKSSVCRSSAFMCFSNYM